MEIRFRNHPSIIFEKIGAIWCIILCYVFNVIINIATDDEILQSIRDLGFLFTVCVVLLTLLGIVLVQFLFHWNRWRKTWIVVDETSITITRNTLKHTSNTINLRTIANVNIEQNLFEMLLGTRKVKIDTDSRSTADSTDMTLVLKKAVAERLRYQLLNGITATTPPEDSPEDVVTATETMEQKEEKKTYDILYSTKNLITHCLFSLPVSTMLLLAGCLIGAMAVCIYLTFTTSQQPTQMLSFFTNYIYAVLFGGTLFMGLLYSTVRDFFRYYHFRCRRIDDRIQLSFGLFKKCSYEIPVNRIHSIVIARPFLSRLFNRCYVDLICVGIGDEKEENVRLLLTIRNAHVAEALHRLLPEFDEYFQEEKEPISVQHTPSIWLRHLWCGMKITVFYACILFLIPLMIDQKIPFLPCAIVYGICMIIYFIGCGMTYRFEKLSIRKNFLSVTSGVFFYRTHFIRYKNIQFLELHQNVTDRILQMQHGFIYILASSMEEMIAIPSFPKKQFQKLISLYLENDAQYHD